MSNTERSNNCVFIANVAFDVTEEMLKDLFSQVGPVVNMHVVIDRDTSKSKGYAFCEYFDKDTALSAQRNLDGVELRGRHLKVDAANSERTKEEMQQLRAVLAERDEEVEKLEQKKELDATEVPGEIAKAITQLSPEQMYELMKQMKLCVQMNKNEARSMLLNQPHLAFALLQVLLCTKKVNFNQAMGMLAAQPTVVEQPKAPIVPPATVFHAAPIPQPVPSAASVSTLHPLLQATSVAPPRIPLLTNTMPVLAPPMITTSWPQAMRQAPMMLPMSTAIPGPCFELPIRRPFNLPMPPMPAARPTVDNDKSALIQQVMNLNEEQIAALPAEHRKTILNVRRQFQNAPSF